MDALILNKLIAFIVLSYISINYFGSIAGVFAAATLIAHM